jgi:inorganic triphosphatase YgiF
MADCGVTGSSGDCVHTCPFPESHFTMLEQEIKMYVPPASRRAVAAEMDKPAPAERIRLRAQYFDTPDRQLARRYAAIRLRLEGRRWVQTFKMAGSDAMSRVEINHARPRPELDLSVYAGTPAEAVIAGLDADLIMRYETDVRRMRRQVRVRTGVVELAYDVGHIRAGTLEKPLYELEIERVSGRVESIFTCADRWLRAHALVIDMRSKSERGDALAGIALAVADAPADRRDAVLQKGLANVAQPRFQGAVELDKHGDATAALDVVTHECLDQIARNAALAAGIDVPAGHDVETEAVHQLRVGIRRLRSAWKLFDGWTPLPEGTLQDGAREQFGALGVARDADVLAGTVLPQLAEAGMPPLPDSTSEAVDVTTLAGGVPFQRWLLAMSAWASGVRAQPKLPPAISGRTAIRVSAAAPAPVPAPVEEVELPAPKGPKLTPLLAKRLHKWHARVAADAKRIGELDDEARHTLRKRAKRLRYGISLSESLLPGKRVKDYRKRLAAFQDVLGEVNDLVVARDRLASMRDEHPQAWFGMGWITLRLEALLADAKRAAKVLAAAKPFWK